MPFVALADDFDVAANEVADFWFYAGLVYFLQLFVYVVGILLIYRAAMWSIRFIKSKLY